MANDTMILGLLAETSVHPGAGQSADVVDLPVAREGATGLPHIPDSGLKGALRQWVREWNGDKADPDKLDEAALFGSPEAGDGGGAGLLLISTARLLCLPVRRLDGPYAWVTTPYLLERLQRDLIRASRSAPAVPKPQVTGDTLLMANAPGGAAPPPVFLEEYSFTPAAIGGDGMVDLAKELIATDQVAMRIAGQAAVMSDQEFAWFAAEALPVNARNALDDETKLSKSLWYEETLPPDTLMYAVIGVRRSDQKSLEKAKAFKDALHASGYLQVGGNETVGQGWLSVKVLGGPQ